MMESKSIIFYNEWAAFRIWLRPQKSNEWVKYIDWSKFIGRMPIEVGGKSYYQVRLWLRPKVPTPSQYGPGFFVVDHGVSYSLIRVWMKHKHLWLARKSK
jgi:hypothetical protein